MNFRKDYPELSFENYVRVVYVPLHAHNDPHHPNCEVGFVSSVNSNVVFVKFVKQRSKFGWNGTTSQACSPESLFKTVGNFWPHITN